KAAPKSARISEAKGNDRKEQRQQAARTREEQKPLRDKVKKLEQQLEREHRKLAELEQQLADPTLYEEVNKGFLAKLLHEQGEMKRQLANTEEAWLEATEQLENS